MVDFGRRLISPSFCRFVPADLLKPQSGKILSLLLPLLEQATGETLYLLLETIRAVLALDQTLLTPQSVGPVADTVYAVWEKYNTGGCLCTDSTFSILLPLSRGAGCCSHPWSLA